MPKIYYRCSDCHNIVNMKELDDYGTKGCLRCNKCNTIVRVYPCQNDYWWERLYLTVREMIRSLYKMRRILLIATIILIIMITNVFAETLTVDELVAQNPTLELIADWIHNNIKYTDDKEVWKKSDYWQSPTETLELRTGDCEDFAILLWACAKKLGIPVILSGADFYKSDGEKTGHAFCLIDYDQKTNTCMGYFDTTGLDMFKERITVHQMMYRFKVHKWIRIYIFKKRNNEYYKEHKGWKILKRIRDE